MKIYCIKCAEPTSYESAKPQFCSHCGANFNESAAVLVPMTVQQASAEIRKSAPMLTRKLTKIPHKVHRAPEPEAEDGDDDEIDNSPVEIPNISELDVEIDASIPRAETLENIISQGKSGGESFTREKVKGRPMSRKKVLDQFRAESASVRPNKTI